MQSDELTSRPFDADRDNLALRAMARVPDVLADRLEAASRPADYSARAALYSDSTLAVMERDGQTVGACGVVFKRVRLCGETVLITYGLDGIVHPSQRGQSAIHRMTAALLTPATHQRQAVATFGVVWRGNAPSSRICDAMGMYIIGASKRFVWRVGPRAQLADPGPSISIVTDPATIAQELETAYGSHDLAPEHWSDITSRAPCLGMATVSAGASAAGILLWDISMISPMDDGRRAIVLFAPWTRGPHGDAELCKLVAAAIAGGVVKDADLIVTNIQAGDAHKAAFPIATAITELDYDIRLFWIGRERTLRKPYFYDPRDMGPVFVMRSQSSL